MNGTTRCPHCETRFRITETQLNAQQGMVRCGCCKQAFDGLAAFKSDQPDISGEKTVKVRKAQVEAPFELEIPDEPRSNAIAAEHVLSLSEQVDDAPLTSKTVATSNVFPLQLGVAFLLALFVYQALFFFRVPIAAHVPGVKPVLSLLFFGEVPLPQVDELISLESSDLESSRTKVNLITLTAQIRNRAAYTQALPHLELTLSDAQEQALARRIFTPEEYLPNAKQISRGIEANRELSIKLDLDTHEVKASGYRLVLFYPKNS